MLSIYGHLEYASMNFFVVVFHLEQIQVAQSASIIQSNNRNLHFLSSLRIRRSKISLEDYSAKNPH